MEYLWTGPKKVSFSGLPALGQLLAKLDLGTNFPLPLVSRRNPPLYEIFIASWFGDGKLPLM